MKRFVLPLLFAVMAASCSQGNRPTTDEIEDPYAFILIDESKSTGERTIKLSDLIEDYRIVTFEDSDSALFKVWKTNVSDNYIIVVQGGAMPIMLFTREGEFVGNVGRPGQGPGEYEHVYDAVIDESRGSIFVAPWCSPLPTLEYNLKGDFLRSHNIPKIAKPAFFINHDGTISASSLTFSDQDDSATALTFDPQNDSIRSIIYPALSVSLLNDAKDEAVGLGNEMWAYRNVPTNVFMTTSNDTLYVYDPERNEIFPRAFLKEKSSKQPDTWYIGMELPQAILYRVNGSNPRTIWLDKKTGEISNTTIINDFAGNATISMSNFRDGYFIQIWEPSLLAERIEDKWLPNNEMTAEQRKELEILRDKIDPEGNNIMFIGKLKR